MHQKIIRQKMNVTGLCIAASLLTACTSTPNYTNAPIQDRKVNTVVTQNESDADTSTPLQQRNYQLERAQHYQRLSSNSEQSQTAINAALSSAEYYIQANNMQAALTSLDQIDRLVSSDQQANEQLNQKQQARYDIVLAYSDYAAQNYRVALNRLQNQLNLTNNPATQTQRVDALLLSSLCYQSLGQYSDAIAVLISREHLLNGQSRTETSRYIWQVINSLSSAQRQQVIQNTNNPLVRNRFEESLQGQVAANDNILPNQFDQWSTPNDETEQRLLDSQWSASSPSSLAVLLPLSSRFNKAAQALADGIEYQHSLNSSNFKPTIQIVDIGNDPSQTAYFYNNAKLAGAELIIGPLGTKYANQLDLHQDIANSPTILLGGDTPLDGNATRLSISPEQQAITVAKRAAQAGYVNAALLVPNNDNRVGQAFKEYWLSIGGKLIASARYSPQQYDHSTELKQLFDINESEYRHTKISRLLGYKPKFNAHSRDDIDFIFMLADNASGRILRPEIKFFGGAKLPILATSAIYNGIADATNNIDLDGTEFPIMPWILKSNDVATYAGKLNMLFAMGTDAYSLAANLHALKADPTLSVQGNMGTLSVSQNGEINYQPLWARFDQGLIQTDIPVQALEQQDGLYNDTMLNKGMGNEHKGDSQYDESNWDHRQSRRKTGT